jgi:hypothetical protein
MQKLIDDLRQDAEFDSREHDVPVESLVQSKAVKLLEEIRTAMQSFVDGDPDLGPEGLIEKHREWFRELLA